MNTNAQMAEPSGQNQVPTGSDWGARVFVWGTGAAMLIVALTVVGLYGSRDTPLWDDWGVSVPVLSGQRPLNTAWLWEQAGDHRFPVPKLILIGLYKVTAYDFRAGMVFNIVTLGLVASAMILA